MAVTYLGNVAGIDTKPSDAGDKEIALCQVDLGRIFSFHELLLEGTPGVGGSLGSVDVGESSERLIVDLCKNVPRVSCQVCKRWL